MNRADTAVKLAVITKGQNREPLLETSSVKYFFVMMPAVLASLGCGGEPEFDQVRITGTVMIDARPIEEGTINFVPQDADRGRSTAADIVAGKYEADVSLGNVRAYFQATRETGRTITLYDLPHPERVNLIPAPYRQGVEINIGPEDQIRNFELLSSRKEKTP